ncbi:DUF4255 domain-containing protein [Agriterribacter sp.]|uniref:DUF4255 domain-containing protein n=1 Tax=Agriterribacter sp. TaxID=2821509 RepID=UPI002C826B10|nr:DUF4255 domain-containing protein [Agriterribacter sp.]HRO45258.1 DUF4255 domain-containing protein [Agriterribacter sp.]HRQ16861.1 DUF4255 domain-containing protein [Agriterribacter sp.]
MIHEALGLLRRELVTYLSSHGYAAAEDIVVIENIGLFESAASGVNLDDKIVFTLVNIEEESTLKNNAFVKKEFASVAQYENPPVFLNLYLLVTACNKSADNNSYTDALERLSLVIAFFQSKNSFSSGGSVSGGTPSFTNEDLLQLTIRHEMYTLSFEQVNHLWGTLGGKQMPFVLYKLRLIAITERKVLREVPLIEEIETHFSKIPTGH